MSLVRMKKIQEEQEGEVESSVHQQCLVTKSCYHQDRDFKKRQNTAAKLRPKVEGRIMQLTAEVRQRQHKLPLLGSLYNVATGNIPPFPCPLSSSISIDMQVLD